MSQAEILEIMKKKPNKWFYSEELGALLDISENSARRNLTMLRYYKLVEHKEIKIKGPGHRRFLYRYKKNGT